MKRRGSKREPWGIEHLKLAKERVIIAVDLAMQNAIICYKGLLYGIRNYCITILL